MNACTGPCQQGRAKCPCPQSCYLADSQPSQRSWVLSDWSIALVLVGTIAGLVFGVFT